MPAPHQSTPNAGSPDEPVDLRASVYQSLIGKGLQPFQAMGVIYSMMGELGGGFNTSAVGDGGRSVGFGQWNGERKANLDKIAAGMGADWRNPSAQLAHFNAEISGPYAAEIERVKQAKNTAEATKLWTGSVGEKSGYERPQVNNWQGRMISGSQAARLDPQTGAPVWTAGPAATIPADAGATAGAAPAAPATSGAQDFAEAAKKGDVGGALAALSKGQGGDDKGGRGPLGKLGDQLGGGGQQAPAASQMLSSGGGDAQGGQAQAGQALLAQVLAQSAKPLTWSTQPFGYGMAGPQISGTTLNSTG